MYQYEENGMECALWAGEVNSGDSLTSISFALAFSCAFGFQ